MGGEQETDVQGDEVRHGEHVPGDRRQDGHDDDDDDESDGRDSWDGRIVVTYFDNQAQSHVHVLLRVVPNWQWLIRGGPAAQIFGFFWGVGRCQNFFCGCALLNIPSNAMIYPSWPQLHRGFLPFKPECIRHISRRKMLVGPILRSTLLRKIWKSVKWAALSNINQNQ